MQCIMLQGATFWEGLILPLQRGGASDRVDRVRGDYQVSIVEPNDGASVDYMLDSNRPGFRFYS
jgi:hypothetical protein